MSWVEVAMLVVLLLSWLPLLALPLLALLTPKDVGRMAQFVLVTVPRGLKTLAVGAEMLLIEVPVLFVEYPWALSLKCRLRGHIWCYGHHHTDLGLSLAGPWYRCARCGDWDISVSPVAVSMTEVDGPLYNGGTPYGREEQDD